MKQTHENLQKGHVALVGAGCGPDLITIKGWHLLGQAEVLVYDDLLDQNLLQAVPEDCERIYVGKRSGRHSMKQEEINRILTDRALAGKFVVRLKGGDSFVFGRGGEEILALQKAGVPYEVVPGVSSSIAVPEHAGIPVTHRVTARSFTVITGSSADASISESFKTLARLQGTLVFLMGIHALPEIAEQLLANGKDPATPASVISNGFTPYETRYDGTLATIADIAAGAETPGIIVIGPTASFHLESNYARPLEHVRVAVTGTASFTKKLGSKLEALGAAVQYCPCLEIIPETDHIPENFKPYSWLVFTSSNGVRLFFRELAKRKTDLRCLMHLRFAVIGSGTAETLAEFGFRADYIPGDYTSAELGKGLSSLLESTSENKKDAVNTDKDISRTGKDTGRTNKNSHETDKDTDPRILILRSGKGSLLLTAALREHGIPFDDIAIYNTKASRQAHPGKSLSVHFENTYISGDPNTSGHPVMSVDPVLPDDSVVSDHSAAPDGSAVSDNSTSSDSDVPDYIVFSSAAGVRAYLDCGYSLPEPGSSLQHTKLIAIGGVTAEELTAHTKTPPAVARTHTADGVIETILRDRNL